MKVGDIIQNPWVNDNSPLRNTMYIGINGQYFESVYYHNGKIQKARWYKQDKEQFEVVGHSYCYDALKESLKDISLCRLPGLCTTTETMGYANQDGLMPAT